MIVSIIREHALVEPPHQQARLGEEVNAKKDVVPAPVGLVGIVGQVVVLKAVDPAVVVEVNAKEQFGPIDVIAQKWLFVVGNGVGHRAVVVLVEVRNEIEVLVPAGEHLPVIGLRAYPCPIGLAVLVVIVGDKFVNRAYGIVVVNVPLGQGDKSRGRIVGIHRVGFAISKKRVGFFGQIEDSGLPALRRDLVPFVGVEQGGIRVLEIAQVVVPFAVEIKAPHVLAFDSKSGEHVGRGQAVVKKNPLGVGYIPYIARGPPYLDEHRLGFFNDLVGQRRRWHWARARLQIRPHFDLEVVS